MPTADQVIKRFQSQLGVVENPFGSNYTLYNDWYFGRKQAAPWCATFLSWCFYNEGLALPATISRGFAYTVSGADWFKRNNKWTRTPKRGHVVFFDFPNDGVNRISHVGIVIAVNSNGSVKCIEGNTDESGSRTGGKVMERLRSVGIVGYGIPDYSQPTPEARMAAIIGAVDFCVMHNNDLVITSRDGAIYHFDADGVADSTDYKGAYNARSDLWGGASPTAVRECIGIYPVDAHGNAVADGSPGAIGYCQVFNDSARYVWK